MLKKILLNGKTPIHEMMLIGVCLAVVGGFLDAYTYIFRGGVFANAQTGNMVLMGIWVSKGNYIKAGFYLIPVSAFFLGIVATEYLKRRFSDSEFVNFQHITLGIETALLFSIGFLSKQVPDPVINVAVSFVCSLQVNSFRKIMGSPYATTMCTGNLRSATEQLCLFMFDKKKEALANCIRYFIIIFSFCCGAAFGAVFTWTLKGKSVWICCALLMAVLFILLWDSRKQCYSK
jgi:uncharacterized membrane protein YoaK (UPF0700 family)